MQIGLIGYAKSGKTTIFNALTQGEAPTDKYHSVHDQAHIAVVQVTDERVSTLSRIYQPKKTIYATIEYHDFPGIFGDPADSPESNIYAAIRNMDGYALVLRSFSDIELDTLCGDADPLRELSDIEQEMILRDLILAEKRLERIELGYKRGVKTPAVQSEERVLHNICEHLQQGSPLRSMQLSAEDAKLVKGFAFFSQKPMLILLNCSEDNLNPNSALERRSDDNGALERRPFDDLSELITELSGKRYQAEMIAGRFEEELSKLDADEAQVFLEDMGIAKSVRERLNHLCYKMMGYISFFTVGADEVRAWTIQQGDNAVTAAGRIHSDLARGFIRAECFRYVDIIAHGSEKVLREKGLFRLEGKDYIVHDGDIISIRFNV
ncbi:MAG: redox-regulated ATPase YchF [Candidatus Cloacimonetes bacterium]|nr:redox-regulated ATPase YchF [Candidatus Cloacimonadota bacterium]